MGTNELLELALSLELTDERQLFSKVIVSYSNLTKGLNVAFGSTQGAGTDGFIGIFKDQLVCYDANFLGSKPNKERFRISFEFIKESEIKKGFLGLSQQFIVKTELDMFKFYVTKKRLNMIEKMNNEILNSRKGKSYGKQN
jgi:hypothetical protein